MLGSVSAGTWADRELKIPRPSVGKGGACTPTRAQHRDLELKHKSGATFTFAV